MSAAASQPETLGATPTTARALAPDLARGGMLLLIALANVHLFIYGQPTGVRGYPRDVSGVDQVVVLIQMTVVDGRAYPLFGLLFGYGVVQLAWRRAAAGQPQPAVTRLVRRRGGWMILIGMAHGVLLWPGDIVSAYGLLAVVLAGVLVAGSEATLVAITAAGVGLTTALSAFSGFPAQGGQAFLPSVAITDPLGALVTRCGEWLLTGLLGQTLVVFASVTAGAWAARRRLLDEPERHARLLVWVASVGLATAVVAGLPLALMAAQIWTNPPMGAVLAAGSLHALGGYIGGAGYAAMFGLVAIRMGRRGHRGPISEAMVACGQRSLSCYLAQSIAFAMLLPAWTLGLGLHAQLWQTALVGLGTWLVILFVAWLSAKAGYRGPAEILLRRLTYGRRAADTGPRPPSPQ